MKGERSSGEVLGNALPALSDSRTGVSRVGCGVSPQQSLMTSAFLPQIAHAQSSRWRDAIAGTRDGCAPLIRCLPHEESV